ncbi:hypothetical protein AB0M43_37750 [Longispora sp. NPDC051575]|uniref:hypothetical protein n=1 Tax=Longispora sp. NPDC051575 TaxID=3154943 RepID=UPI00342E7EA2
MNRRIAVGLAAVGALALLVCGLPLLAVISAPPIAPSCGGTGGGADPGPSGQWNAVQMQRAAAIVSTGRSMGVSGRGQVIAIATAITESGLRNLANTGVPESLALPNDGQGHDHDSVGLFQQRPSPPAGQGSWGTVADIMNPPVSAKKFYTALLRVPGWETLPLAEAAQAVQRSALPDAYARHEPEAARLVATMATVDGQPVPVGVEHCQADCPPAVGSPTPLPTQVGTSAATGACPGATAVLARAATWLTAWSGGPVPYMSSGDPATWFQGFRRDCSGYVSMALGRTGPGLDTAGLAAASTPIPATALQPGDLLINAGSGPAGHVVLFERWANDAHTTYYGFEQAGDGGTKHRVIPYPYGGGYPMSPYRPR